MKSKDNIILNKINNYIIEINDFIIWEVIHNEFPSFKNNIENILKNKKK